MKKIISIGASLVLAVNVFATGNLGVNTPQSGVLLSTNLVTGITNTFAQPFQSTPLLYVFASATNGTPVTNAFVTTTNFGITFPVNGSTNNSFAWSAFVGGTKLQSGANTNTAAASTTITFPTTYALPPVVVVTPQGGTNAANVAAVTSITSSNFVLLANASQTNYWMSVGTVAYPQTDYQGANPGSNKILAQ